MVKMSWSLAPEFSKRLVPAGTYSGEVRNRPEDADFEPDLTTSIVAVFTGSIYTSCL